MAKFDVPEPDISPAVAISPKASDRKRLEAPAAAPYNALPKYMPPVNHSPEEGTMKKYISVKFLLMKLSPWCLFSSSFYEAPSTHHDMGHSHDAQQPIISPQKAPFHRVNLSPTSPPMPSNYKHHRSNPFISHAPAPSYPISSRTTETPGIGLTWICPTSQLFSVLVSLTLKAIELFPHSV